MDFKDLYYQLAERVDKLKESIATEEATKNALVLPFIQMLGYDVFNPTEVVPEMDCDLNKKKGEKIDYSIVLNGEPIILIECKHWKQDLHLHDTQLRRYFVASKARFGILTNGIVYRFYSDLAKPNIMDDIPFLEINLEDIRKEQIEEVKKFHKSYFDMENIITSASELKYMSELQKQIKAEFESPSTELVKLLAKRIYDGSLTQRVQEKFTELVKRSLANHVNDVISERLNIAMQTTDTSVQNKNDVSSTESNIEEKESNSKFLIVTTEEELQGFYLIKSLLYGLCPSDQITYRDAQTYFSILYDNNRNKLICRLHFNSTNKYIELLDINKKGTKYKLDNIDDIYNYKDQLIETVQRYIVS